MTNLTQDLVQTLPPLTLSSLVLGADGVTARVRCYCRTKANNQLVDSWPVAGRQTDSPGPSHNIPSSLILTVLSMDNYNGGFRISNHR